MKGLIDVKPKEERIYQAMQYTGENMYDIYRLFRKHSIKFNVNNDYSDVYPILNIEYTGCTLYDTGRSLYSIFLPV